MNALVMREGLSWSWFTIGLCLGLSLALVLGRGFNKIKNHKRAEVGPRVAE